MLRQKQFIPFPLHEDLAIMLRELKGDFPKVGRLFPQYSTHRSTPVFWIRLIKRLIKAQEPERHIDHAYTFHQLRKTFATWLANQGVHSNVLKVLLDHSSEAVTTEFYTENHMKVFKEIVDKVSFGGQV